MRRRRLLLTIPLGIAAGCGLGFYDILRRMGEGRYDPHALPSPLVGHPPPRFRLPGIGGAGIGGAGIGGNGAGFASTDLAAPPKPMLVNFFASWCVPCAVEAPMLDRLAKSGLAIWGIAYEDKAAAVADYLKRYGNPYARLAADADGRTAIDWGLYGVPETYLIDRAGIVRWRWAGPLTEDIVRRGLDPLLRDYA